MQLTLPGPERLALYALAAIAAASIGWLLVRRRRRRRAMRREVARLHLELDRREALETREQPPL
jgi:hypothetical protein